MEGVQNGFMIDFVEPVNRKDGVPDGSDGGQLRRLVSLLESLPSGSIEE
jgi:hypothetical protein